MTSKIGCPDRDTLANMLQGKLSEAERVAIGSHLKQCEACAEAASSLSAADDLPQATLMPPQPQGDSQQPPKHSATIPTVDSSRPAEETSMSDAANSPTPASSANHKFEFLAAPQQADEIGRLGDYRILEVLGHGGMGVVFRAEDSKLKRQVAIKVMKPSLASHPIAKDRFIREAQFTSAIEHDNIVHIYQVGEDNGVPYIAMPLLKGESLQARLRRKGQLSQTDVVKIGIQVASGLAAAHNRNLIHRDIKPDNLWLDENTGRVKILDFGLVRATADDAGLTQSGAIMGTPRYMAPEQALGKAVDARCDLFSLGSVLYHLISGKLPFDGSNVTATLLAVVHQEPPPLDTLVEGISGDLSRLIHQLISKDLHQRPQNAAEVVKKLTAIHKQLKQTSTAVPDSIPSMPPAIEGRSLVSGAVSTPTPEINSAIGHSPRAPGWRFLLASGVAGILLALLGIIIYTTTDKGGEKPGDKPLVVVPVEPPASPTPPPSPPPVVNPDSDPIEPPAKTVEAPPAATASTATKGARSLKLGSIDAVPKTGWQGWPEDAPKPAIAPFDANQANIFQQVWADYLKVPVEYTNSIGMKLRLVPPGEFMMGSTEREVAAALRDIGETPRWKADLESETPQHKVIVPHPIFIGINEVTQAEYEQIVGSNPSRFAASGSQKEAMGGMSTFRHPVESVTWLDAVRFCIHLSSKENLSSFYSFANAQTSRTSGIGYRLPTEPEWEFACRAGTTTKYWSGDSTRELDRVAWSYLNSQSRTHTVRELKANPFGLFDVHGNAGEWAEDRSLPYSYGVMRGGSIDHGVACCRSAARHTLSGSANEHVVGLRLSLTIEAVRQAMNVRGPALPSIRMP